MKNQKKKGYSRIRKLLRQYGDVFKTAIQEEHKAREKRKERRRFETNETFEV